MTDEMTLALWRLVSDLTVEDAAILVAGGDPSAVDWEHNSFGDQQYPVKRTDGHPGFLAVFTSLKTAIRKGYLRAELAYEADESGGYSNRISGRTWVMSSFDLSQIRTQVAESPFDDIVVPEGASLQITVEPDWKRSTIDVEDLKAWLRSRGHHTGFFFPPEEPRDAGTESIVDPSHDHFAPELALAVSAWRALEHKSGFARGSKAAIEGWIDANPEAWLGGSDLSANAKDRIVTVVNWRKSGGAPSTGG